MVMYREFRIGSVLKETLDLSMNVAGVVVPWAVIVMFLGEIVSMELLPEWGILAADLADQGFMDFLIDLLVSTVFSSLVVLICFNAALKHQRGVEPSFTGFFEDLGRHYLPMLLCSLLVVVLITFGSVLLLVPGLFALTRLWVATSVVYIDRLGVAEAIRRSDQLTKGNSWSVFGALILIFGVFFTAFYLIGEAILDINTYLGHFISAVLISILSFFVNVMALVGYQHLVREKEGESQDSIQAVFE